MKRLMALMGLILLVNTPLATATVSDTEFQQMQQMLTQALARIKELEQHHETSMDTRVQPNKSAAASDASIATAGQVMANTVRLEKMSWAERVRLNGDFLYRYQYDEGKGFLGGTNSPEPDRSRNRQRIRAHLAVIATLPKDIEVGIGFATGGDSPVSAVQTLGGSGSSKDLQLDLAYFDWQFKQDFHLAMGKIRNRFYRPAGSGLLWDSDWRPEGLDFRYDNDLVYINTLGTWLEGDSNKDGSSFNYGLQAGFKPQLGNTRFNVGVGYWKIKTEGVNCFDAPSSTAGNGAARGCFGNTATDGQGALVVGGTPAIYVMGYAPVELYATAEFDTPLPFSVFVDFARNTDAKAIPAGPSQGQKLDTAYAFGASLGSSRQAGDWQFKLTYQDIEADSVLALLTDSDFAGGGTDSKGFKLAGKYMLTEQASLGFTYYHTERQDSNGVENGSSLTSNPFDVNTLQVNVLFKAK